MKTQDQFWSSPSTGLGGLSWGAYFWLLFASMVNGLITSALFGCSTRGLMPFIISCLMG